MSVLDEISTITQHDSSNALELVSQQVEQLLLKFEIEAIDRPINKVILAGIGGSALAAEVINSWTGLGVPFVIVRDYKLPNWADDSTLVITSSYSGNTEEALSCFDNARQARAMLAILTSGGKLHEIALSDNLPLAKLPDEVQPRMSTFAQLKALVSILVAYKLLDPDKLVELEATATALRIAINEWRANTPTASNQAKQIAEQLVGKTPIIYSSEQFYPSAYKWKIDFNENSKNTAWCNRYPEYNHNEFIGWTSQPIEKPFAPINLLSHLDHPQIIKRFKLSDRLLSGRRPQPIDVHLEGSSVLEQTLWAMCLGDQVSIYLAFLNKVDPTPVELIERLKSQLE